MAEAAAGLGLIASFIEIMRFLADILKTVERNEEAKAVEKAAKAIETGGNVSPSQAKETFARTLTKELGSKNAQPLIDYTEIIDTLFPFSPSGTLLKYGLATQQLIAQIHSVLSRFQTFELFGQRKPDGQLSIERDASKGYRVTHRLKFDRSGQALHKIWASRFGRHSRLLGSFLYGKPFKMAGIRFYYELQVDRGPRLTVPHLLKLWVGSEVTEPFSLLFIGPTISYRRRLHAREFSSCMESLIGDTNHYLKMVARELELSRKHERKFVLSMKALRQLGTSEQAPEAQS